VPDIVNMKNMLDGNKNRGLEKKSSVVRTRRESRSRLATA
jgi:hypothetical protein